MNNHTILLDIRRNALATQGDTDRPRQPVCTAFLTYRYKTLIGF